LLVSPSKSSSVCSQCQQGKSHCFHFSYSPSISNNPLQLLFLDVCSPASITSVNNNHFYLSVVDDFCKYTWLFPLATKSEVCATFLRFKQLVETFFNTKIKFVQSDNGGEFLPLQKSLNSMGVSYRLSCPHTHHQMGTVERKHRHVVETGLSLLATASVPFTFWDTAFEIATYLINRLPSKVTNKRSPYECLFHSIPNYKYLKIFGCECWPFLRPYNSSKPSFRSTSCVFIRYRKTISAINAFISPPVEFTLQDMFSMKITFHSKFQNQTETPPLLKHLHLYRFLMFLHQLLKLH
jgi:hypothetical protein